MNQALAKVAATHYSGPPQPSASSFTSSTASSHFLFFPSSSPDANSFFLQATTRTGATCSVIDVSSVALKLGAANVVALIKKTAARLRLPEKVQKQLEGEILRAISEAQKKTTTRMEDTYRPTSLMRKVPIVGGLFGYFGAKSG